jgi:oligoendopeptidase F
MQGPPNRQQIASRHKWNLAAIYPSDAAWEQAISAFRQQLSAFAAHRAKLVSPPAVADCLAALDSIRFELGKLAVYAHSEHSVDTRDQNASANQSRAISLIGEALGATAFVEPELLALGVDTLQQWAAADARLAIYEQYFASLARRAQHVRNDEIEELLGQLMDPFRMSETTHSILADADLTFAPAHASDDSERAISQGTLDALLADPDRKVRRTAYESYADAHLALRNTMANCMATGVKQDVFLARARRYGSALEGGVLPHFVPPQVFHNVVDAFVANLPIWHRYWRVRRQALGYDTLHEYDIKAPLATGPRVPFETAVDWISEGLVPLGREYVTALRRGVLEENWVDVYPNLGKSSGAFSSGAPGTSPLILMSYTDDIESLSTLAHELGHSMHSYSSWQTQPLVYADYTILLAEVASNFNQALVRDYLLRTHTEPSFQIALIEEAMSNFHRYLFLMPTLARFELEIHQRVESGRALTADALIQLMNELFAQAYGGEVEIDPQRTGITWAAFHTHLYANFYVYQYTTGISGGQALAAEILQGTPGAVERYLQFLRSGSSRFPIDTLQRAGLDLTQPEPIQKAYDYLSTLVDRLEQLVAAR